MRNTEKLYNAFGELLYAVIKAEGKARENIIKKLERTVQEYEWGQTAMWSLRYEMGHNATTDEAYQKAFDAFTDFGPFPGYESFFRMVDDIIKKNILGERGKKVIGRFRKKLMDHFYENHNIYFDDLDADEDGKDTSGPNS